jgi:exosortase
MAATQPADVWRCADWPARAGLTVLLSACTLFAFRTLLAGSAARWQTEPQYSHGFAIPILSAALIWLRRDRILPGTARSASAGLLCIAVGGVCHVVSAWLFLEALDSAGFLSVCCGITLLVWGRRCFLGIWPAILFPAFMLPLPYQLEHLLSDPLQVFGAQQATWLIQTCGIPAIAQGNTILMSDTQLGVAEACSGLRMLMVFAAISSAAAMISRRTTWEKLVMLISAVPIALICNIARIVATAIAHETVGRQTADLIFHDLSGWLMMPLAALLLYLELRLLDWLFVVPRQERPGLTLHGMVPIFTVRQQGGLRP